ncbi:hypothetical protein [Arcobacter defluvii]|uniref:Uncharacterized protein n=2 Tax=Arcobacter TaxID=28196 RepID=A0AAE7BEE1_9BACT|nr:hypothetical protein [Arcobacter defluvii]QKF76239.1 hypothetical protein ADFLV_0172 [Arcobacter defluvii]RXI30921.1 hypothetical protein CP964_10710 [Arcobacter defluvii]
MIRQFILLITILISSFSQDTLTAQKQNTLYIQDLIQIEENIAKNFEKYILSEYKIPTITDLIDDNYLGSNFSVLNRMGENIDFKDSSKLQLKYAITKDEYRKTKDENLGIENFLVQLYNRDLYRDYTTVFSDDTDVNNMYVEFELKSDEAKNIFDLLKNGNSIAKTCVASLKSTYCNNNDRTIRWYNASSNWIEYDKKDFNKGNITVSSESILTSETTKLSSLKVGSYIFIKDKTKNVKMIDDSSGNLQILKVD